MILFEHLHFVLNSGEIEVGHGAAIFTSELVELFVGFGEFDGVDLMWQCAPWRAVHSVFMIFVADGAK